MQNDFSLHRSSYKQIKIYYEVFRFIDNDGFSVINCVVTE